MRQVAAVAWREIVEHRVFVWAAFAALAVTIVVPLAPAFVGWSPTDIREVLMWGMALCFVWVSAAFMGGSMIAGTVAAGRFGFFMARPVTGATVWFGKLLGVAVVLVICELIVILPAALLTDPAGLGGALDDIFEWIGVVVAVPILLVLLTHAIATTWHGKSAWIALDLAALTLLGVAGWAVVDHLLSVGAVIAAAIVVPILLAAVAASILAGGLLQVSQGRCDGRRQHKIFSLAAWSFSVVLVGGTTVYGLWLTHPELGDLEYVDGDVVVHPGGEWLTVAGPTKNRFDVNAQFLLNLNTLESTRIGVGSRWFGRPLSWVSSEQRIAWFVLEGGGWNLHSGNLEDVAHGGQRSAISVDTEPRFVLSDRGDRVAMIEEDILVVSTLPVGNLLGSAKLSPDRMYLGPFFRSNDRIWVVESQSSRGASSPPPVKMLQFDINSQQMREIGILTECGTAISADIDDERGRVLLGVVFNGQRRWVYLSSDSFSEVSWAAVRGLGSTTTMLADGRLVGFVEEDEGPLLEVITPDGVTEMSIPLPMEPERLWFGGQPSPHTLVFGVQQEDWERSWIEGTKTYGADLETGSIFEIEDGAFPLVAWYRFGRIAEPLPAGSPAAKVMMRPGARFEERMLVMWNPEIHQTEMLVPLDG